MATLDNQIDNFLGAIGEEVMLLEKKWSIKLGGKGGSEGLFRTITWVCPDDILKRTVTVFLRPIPNNISYYETVVEVEWPTGKKESQTFSSKTPSECIAWFVLSRFM